MHEFSVVQSLLDLIEENIKLYNGKRASKVIVKVGKMSGIEPHLLELAFNTFKEGTVADKCEFIMEIQDIICKCQSCNNTFKVENFEFVCPYCSSIDIDVIDGKDMILKSLEIES